MARRRSRGWLVWTSLGVLAILTVLLVRSELVLGSETAGIRRGQEVRRGPLRITVLEKGNLEAADSAVLKSEIEGRTTILWMVEEGEYVQKGDLVCELDTSDLEERRVSQEISVQNREAAYVKAQQNFAIQESQNQSEISRAEREKLFAEMDRTKYVEGDFPQQRQEQDEAILLAEEELTRATQDLEWSERLAAKGFLENTQLEADRLAQKRAEIKVAQSKRALALLEEFEHPRRMQELDADVEEKGRELERVELQAEARIVDYEAAVRTSKAQFELEREKLAKIDAQLAKAKMHAPRSGMVVYYKENDRWGGGEPLQEGAEIRERQEIITIPSAGNMIAVASLHESVLESVQVGMPCLITVDAIPDASFNARVKFKALLPDQVSRWMNPDLRVYKTTVELLDADERLRPGMSCSVEIIVDEIPDTTFMPLQATFSDAGEHVAFVEKSDGEWEMRPVSVGQNDGKWVEVKSGVEAGEYVLLSAPDDAILRPEPEEESSGGFGDLPTGGTPSATPGATSGAERGGPAAMAGRGDRSSWTGGGDASQRSGGADASKWSAGSGERSGDEGGGAERGAGGPGGAPPSARAAEGSASADATNAADATKSADAKESGSSK